MARDDRPPLAVGEPGLELVVQLHQPLTEPGGGVLGTEQLPEPLSDLRVADRVEPDVRIAAVLELERVQEIDRCIRTESGVFDGRLEAAPEVEDEIRRLDPLDVARRELEVVGLDARRRQVLDLDRIAPDLLRRECERIGAGDGLEAPACLLLVGPTARAGSRSATRARGARRTPGTSVSCSPILAEIGTILILM